MRTFISFIAIVAFFGAVVEGRSFSTYAISPQCQQQTDVIDNNAAINTAEAALVNTPESCKQLNVSVTSPQCTYAQTSAQATLSCACVATYTNETFANYTTAVNASNGRTCLLDVSFSVTGYVNISNSSIGIPLSESVTHSGIAPLAFANVCNTSEIREALNIASTDAVSGLSNITSSVPNSTVTNFITVISACNSSITLIGIFVNGTTIITSNSSAPVIISSTGPVISSTGNTGSTGGNNTNTNSSSSISPSGTTTTPIVPNNSSSSSGLDSSSGTVNPNSTTSSSSFSSSSPATGNNTQPGGDANTNSVSMVVAVITIMVATLLL